MPFRYHTVNLAEPHEELLMFHRVNLTQRIAVFFHEPLFGWTVLAGIFREFADDLREPVAALPGGQSLLQAGYVLKQYMMLVVDRMHVSGWQCRAR